MAKENLDSNKTLVIVGGNSIALGRGQGADLWTETLQRKLGPTYKVLNFAQPGMPAFSGPYITFLILYEKYKKLCYVAVTNDLRLEAPDVTFKGYPYWWDAYYKRLLPNLWRLDMMMNENHESDKSNDSESLEEKKLGAFLDSIFYFEDLWTTIGYKSFFTVWTKPTAKTFTKPREDYVDFDEPPVTVDRRFKNLDLQWEHQQATMYFKDFLERDRSTQESKFSKQYLKWFERAARDTLPEAARSRILLLRVRENLAVVKRVLSEDELDTWDRAADINQKIWNKTGCHALDLGRDYEPENYLDGCHLSGSGGAKLADAVRSSLDELLRDSTTASTPSKKTVGAP